MIKYILKKVLVGLEIQHTKKYSTLIQKILKHGVFLIFRTCVSNLMILLYIKK